MHICVRACVRRAGVRARSLFRTIFINDIFCHYLFIYFTLLYVIGMSDVTEWTCVAATT